MSTIAEVDEIVKTVVGEHDAGVAVAVIKDGQLAHGKGYGLANLEWSIPVQPDTVFGLASLTKQFTATAILLLEQQGLLRLEDPVTRFLPNYPTQGHTITVAHLLTHTSGIVPYNEIDNFFALYLRKQFSHEEILALFQDLPLEFAPGTRYKYNNSGYYLLGMIIEILSGKKYEQFLQEQIFAPVGMQDTHYMWNEVVIPRRAGGYVKIEQGYRIVPYLDMTIPFSGGAIGSTLTDLVRWDAALEQGQVLSKPLLKRMYTPTLLANGTTTEYGFGWGVGDYRGHRVVYHQGEINGFLTFLARFLDDAVTVILLSNANGRDLDPLFRRIVRAALAIAPLKREGSTLDPDAQKRMTGTYTLGKMFKCVVEQTGQQMFLRPFDVELLPIGETVCCFAHDHEIEARFSDPDDQGFGTLTLHFPFSPLTLMRQKDAPA